MHRSLQRIGQALAFVALTVVLGGHWFVLQSFAWATMLAKNSESGRFATAVEKTFDGQHPCEICKGIAAAKGKESKQHKMAVASKLNLFCEVRQTVPAIVREGWRGLVRVGWGDAGRAAPAAPPPRSELA